MRKFYKILCAESPGGPPDTPRKFRKLRSNPGVFARDFPGCSSMSKISTFFAFFKNQIFNMQNRPGVVHQNWNLRFFEIFFRRQFWTKLHFFCPPEKVLIFAGIISGKPTRLPLKMVAHFLGEFWAKYGHFWGGVHTEKNTTFCKKFFTLFFQNPWNKIVSFRKFSFLSKFLQKYLQNFSEKKCTFLSSKIILDTPSGRPGKPMQTQGGTDPKIWLKLAKFSSGKKSNFSRKFPYFLLRTFRKNPRTSIDFYEKK